MPLRALDDDDNDNDKPSESGDHKPLPDTDTDSDTGDDKPQSGDEDNEEDAEREEGGKDDPSQSVDEENEDEGQSQSGDNNEEVDEENEDEDQSQSGDNNEEVDEENEDEDQSQSGDNNEEVDEENEDEGQSQSGDNNEEVDEENEDEDQSQSGDNNEEVDEENEDEGQSQSGDNNEEVDEENEDEGQSQSGDNNEEVDEENEDEDQSQSGDVEINDEEQEEDTSQSGDVENEEENEQSGDSGDTNNEDGESESGDEDGDDKDDEDYDDDDAFRVLYIVTSSGRTMRDRNFGEVDRWTGMIAPLLKQSIGSYFREDGTNHHHNDGSNSGNNNNNSKSHRKYRVDLYMITSYTPSQEAKDVLRQSLPPSVGIQYWSDASPLIYHCEEYLNEPASSQLQGCVLWSESESLMFYRMKLANDTADFTRPEVRLREAPAQLARQHRYVIKDKLPYYDFFVVQEDDMVYTRDHVETHLRISAKAAALKTYKAPPTFTRDQWTGKHSWNERLQRKWLRRMKAGFVRVEVLAESHRRSCKPTQMTPNWKITEETAISIPEPIAENAVEPNTCCRLDLEEEAEDRDSHGTPLATNTTLVARQAFTDKPFPSTDDLILWETKLVGFLLHPWTPIEASETNATKTSWFAAPIVGPRDFPGRWAGHQITNTFSKEYYQDGLVPEGLKYLAGGRLIAQSGGWLASAGDIILYHTDLCRPNKVDFLPPFDFETHPRDGLHRHNVEYWSGGIQIYSEKGCRVQRVYDMDSADSFSKHLVYHASNNKQCFFKFLQQPPHIPNSIQSQIDLARQVRLEEKKQAEARGEDVNGKTYQEKKVKSTGPEFWKKYIDRQARLVRVQNLWNHLVETKAGILRDYLEEFSTEDNQ
eukprot:jgi/Psemu1/326092/estExt_fgenesh1_pg.C_3280008